MTERQQILGEVKDTIADISDLDYVEVNRVTTPDIEQAGFPACFIFGGSQKLTGRFNLVGQKVWEWEIFLSVWTDISKVEDLLGKISNKIAKDPTLNKKAIDCDLDSIDINIIDADRSMVNLVMVFNTIYRHEFGAA